MRYFEKTVSEKNVCGFLLGFCFCLWNVIDPSDGDKFVFFFDQNGDEFLADNLSLFFLVHD